MLNGQSAVLNLGQGTEPQRGQQGEPYCMTIYIINVFCIGGFNSSITKVGSNRTAVATRLSSQAVYFIQTGGSALSNIYTYSYSSNKM